jgi:hypothetical protein
MNRLVSGLPQIETSSAFTTKLFDKIGQEGFAKRKTRAYMPKRIPFFSVARLATAASAAVIILALGIGFNLGDGILYPSSPQIAGTTVPDVGTDEDRYRTVQPIDNPLLNEHKSVSKIIEQYNRWREYSKSLRVNAAAEQFQGGGQGMTLASSRIGSPSRFIIRPVTKNYRIVP